MTELEGDLFCEEDFIIGFGGAGFGGGVASKPFTNKRGVTRFFFVIGGWGSRRIQLPQA